jgi:hypothetical protein
MEKKYKHTHSIIGLIKKWEGREGEFAWIFHTDKFNRSYPNVGKQGKGVYIYKNLSLAAEPGNFWKNEHKHI